MIGYFFDHHYLNRLLIFIIIKKIKNTDTFSSVALALDKNGNVSMLKQKCRFWVCPWKGSCLLASSVFDKEKWAAPVSRTKMHCSQSDPKNGEFVFKLKRS